MKVNITIPIIQLDKLRNVGKAAHRLSFKLYGENASVRARQFYLFFSSSAVFEDNLRTGAVQPVLNDCLRRPALVVVSVLAYKAGWKLFVCVYVFLALQAQLKSF